MIEIDRIWQEQIKSRLDKEISYRVWKEWLELVWRLPTEEEIIRRVEEVDYDGLPFEYMKVYGNRSYRS